MDIATADVETVSREIAIAHLSLEGPLLPILNAIQQEFSYVPQAVIPVIADVLNLTRAEVFGVVSFYHDYRENPAGRHVLKMCRAEACQSMGGEAIASHISAQTGVAWGETSADGAVTLESVYCLGLCACAPALMLDGEVHGRVTNDAADALMAGCRS